MFSGVTYKEPCVLVFLLPLSLSVCLSLSSHSLCLVCLSMSVCLCSTPPPPPPIFYSLSFSVPSIIIFYYFRTQPSQVLDFVHLVDIVNFLVHVVLFLGNISTFADDNIIIYIIYHTVVTKACCFVHPVLVERLFLLFSPVQ